MNDLITTASAISTFDSHFGSVRTVTIDYKVWFVAADVCKILGIKNTTEALANLDLNDVGEIRLSNRGGRPHKLVNQSGLYALVLQSRKPTARNFQRYLTSEVIPSIFKYGLYVVGQDQMTDAQLQEAVSTRGGRLIARTRAERHAQVTTDVAKFTALNGRAPTSRERFWVEKP